MNKSEIKISHPPEWPTKTIYEACQIVSRGTAPVYVENSIVLAIGQRCVREFGLQPKEARFHDQRSMTRVLKACKRDVLLNSTGTGTIGRSCIFNADGTYIIDGHVTLLRSDPDQLDGRWLNALLQSSQGQLHLETQCYSGSTNQVELSRERLSATSIPLPSLPEQRRIAEILDTIDEAIQKTEALISKLKAMKQGLLHDLLTRGLDKNGKLRDPKAHPEQFKDSPLGRIPKEWEVHEIGNCGNIITGTTPNTSRSTYYGGDIPFISPADLNNSRYVRSASGYLTDSGAAYARMLPEGTVLVSCIGILGKIGQLQHKATTNQQINAIIPNSMLEHSFTFWVAHLLKRQLDIVAGLQVVPIVNKTTFIRLLVPVPHVSEQIKGSSMLDAHDARIRAEEQYREKLKLQKKGLMHDLLTGKVRVRFVKKTRLAYRAEIRLKLKKDN